jgi:hypothetical protein
MYAPRIVDMMHLLIQALTLDGVVTCLEQGCDAVIPLGARSSTSDGGKVGGFGSLANYTV